MFHVNLQGCRLGRLFWKVAPRDENLFANLAEEAVRALRVQQNSRQIAMVKTLDL